MNVHADARRTTQVLALARCAHPRQAALMGVGVGVAAAVAGRPAREALVAGAAVLVAQLALGLVNDVFDERADVRSGAPGKPVAEGVVPSGNASFVAILLALLLVPLSLQNGTVAGGTLLLTLAVGFAHNRWLHRTWLSWAGWAATFGLLPAFLSYGGWGGGLHGGPPTVAMTVVAALLGVCVHFLTTLPDLVVDHQSGARNLPLLVALRVGAPRLLAATVVATVLVVAALVVVALRIGLQQ
ncbi:MAG TPA: UbiA family prenyltransferase [Marmoricola sp.]|jgi:4-hydroxybenzoate polyprenyltransferase|nr:UbiA family prenyltransferase [Marmoricola sp.]